MMRPILRKLSEMGIRNVMYVDDGWVVASTKDKANADYAIALFYFKRAGFIVALEKSDPIGAASQRKEYLGFLIDTKAMIVDFRRQKMLRIKDLLEKFLTSNTHKVREIASMIGKLKALEPALGKSIFVRTRLATIAVVVATQVSDNVKRRRNPWESILKLDEETMAALKEVNDGMERWNGHPIRAWHTGITLSSIFPREATASLDRKIPARRVHDRRASDASDFAVASYSIEGIPEFSFSAELQDKEKKESSSVRELLAILRTLDHINGSSQLQTSEWTTLWWLTDNANVEKMIVKGSGKLRITRVVLEILRKGRTLKYNVHPIWVSRNNPFLQKADCLSKGIDSDNWSVGAEDFFNLEVRFCPFTIDLFSTCKNKKTERFYSRSFERGNKGTDAFAQK
jgi:hypothetical protein